MFRCLRCEDDRCSCGNIETEIRIDREKLKYKIQSLEKRIKDLEDQGKDE